jgi:hypothetical protein
VYRILQEKDFLLCCDFLHITVTELCGIDTELYGIDMELCGIDMELCGIYTELCGIYTEFITRMQRGVFLTANLLTSRATVSFSRKALLHGVKSAVVGTCCYSTTGSRGEIIRKTLPFS